MQELHAILALLWDILTSTNSKNVSQCVTKQILQGLSVPKLSQFLSSTESFKLDLFQHSLNFQSCCQLEILGARAWLLEPPSTFKFSRHLFLLFEGFSTPIFA